MYSIELSEHAVRQLAKLEKQDAKRIIASLERCRTRPHSFVKRLVGSPHYRLRARSYRIIMSIKNARLAIIVITIEHRRRAYR